MALTANEIQVIHHAIDLMFDKIKGSFLGPEFINRRKDKDIFVSFKPHASLPGIYTLAAKEELAVPNKEALNTIVHVADGYLEAHRNATKASVVSHVTSFLEDAKRKGIKTNLKTVLEGELSSLFGKVRENVVKVIASESNNAKNLGTLEGIVKMNLLNGIEDPVVAFIGPNDSHVCEECRKVLYVTFPNKPKAFLLSEVKSGYHKRGETSPSMYGMHPRCRHALCAIMPGWGFGDSGQLKYFDKNYRELDKQRSSGI